MRVVVSRTLKNIVKMKYENNVLYVNANLFVTRGKIKRLIEDNLDWLRSKKEPKQADKSEAVQQPSDSCCDSSFDQQQLIKDIFSGRKTMILGDVVSVECSAATKTYLDGNTLYISEKNFSDRLLRIKAIQSYLKKVAFLFVANEVSSFGSSVSLCPQKIEFKDIADCWCKCSLAAQKILCFDYRLTQLPQNLRFYVIAHAFAHFKYPSHDEDFWDFLSNVMPQYANLDKQLANYDFLKEIL